MWCGFILSIMYERTVNRERIFSGRILDLDVVDVELEDGRKSRREVVSHRGAVGVLAVLPDDRLVLVRQFRKAVERHCLEIVAGLLEPDESAEECARREMLEETGYGIDSISKLGTVALSPGYSTECIQLFFACLEPNPNPQALDEDEHCEVVEISKKEFRRRIQAGEIADGKTLSAWTLYESRFGDRSG